MPRVISMAIVPIILNVNADAPIDGLHRTRSSNSSPSLLRSVMTPFFSA